jgi:hypothetical protein
MWVSGVGLLQLTALSTREQAVKALQGGRPAPHMRARQHIGIACRAQAQGPTSITNGAIQAPLYRFHSGSKARMLALSLPLH